MSKNIVTQATFISKVTDITKDYLDKGWVFNLGYMRCSNGTYFTAVTDGTETNLIYFQEKYDFFTEFVVLRVEKFNTASDNIFAGEGEVIHEEVFVKKYSKVYTDEKEYFKVNSVEDIRDRKEKHDKRVQNRIDFDKKSISEPMKEALANFVKSKGIPGLKRFKASDISSVSYITRQNKYKLEIKSHRVYVFREGWDVMVF